MEKQDKIEIISNLISKYREGTLSREEQAELDTWLAESPENRSLLAELMNPKVLAEKLKVFSEVDSDAIWQKTMQQIDPAARIIQLQPAKRMWWKYAAAAAVIGLSVAGWFYFQSATQQQPVVAEQQHTNGNAEIKDDILPGSSKATLTLMDGQTVALDNTGDEQKIQQHKISISRTNGRLIYSGNEANGRDPIAVGSTVLYNTVTTPRGGQYEVVLPDGSIAWLNAASSLRFPIAFAGSERKVLLTGEAFFKITPNKNKPFRVEIQGPQKEDGGTVEVLGTTFNVNAYTDDALIRTTLLEGAVKLTTKEAKQVLKPGQEAAVHTDGKIRQVTKVDIATAVPWRNGFISLESDLKVVLENIARWYNLGIEYRGTLPAMSLAGKIPRSYSIDVALEALQSQGIKLELKRKERKIVVTI
ncbi:hypothetical protein HB364_19790 [Pseudoflavitalea sp. X16]|uniref:FecR domain-containing protein n=1 Tax=Paraflavitalea devenefica TaxID=2716334 RepID=UPI00142133C7|nr:FecR domain-containing protein [Paraflavitalea devenefica]NII27342.1 hypothetical protein [Paraflavitalea devenefica]